MDARAAAQRECLPHHGAEDGAAPADYHTRRRGKDRHVRVGIPAQSDPGVGLASVVAVGRDELQVLRVRRDVGERAARLGESVTGVVLSLGSEPLTLSKV